MINLWPFLLPAAAWSGWWVAQRGVHKKEKQTAHYFSREYVVGLNYLLNEQPDKAVDVFIKLLEVDNDTVETHLALGSLFRRRGEVDRAIRVHQNLIARPQLSVMQRKESLMALAHDYMSAGVFDRAEHIFLETLDMGGTHEVNALKGLLAIYQQEKAWVSALEILKKIEVATGSRLSAQAAHYHCELACDYLKHNAYDEAYQSIKKAILTDKNSVRASLLLASVEMRQGQCREAIKSLKRVPEQDAEFLSEVIEPLALCYQELDAMDECVDYLAQILAEHPRSSLIFVIGDYFRQEKGIDLAIEFVSNQLGKHPSIRGLNKLIYWHLESTQGKVRPKLQMLYDITSKFLHNKPVYRCSHCGYSGKLLHWFRPSCKHWGRIKPIHGLEGD